jgi:hypothetical protein
MTLCAGEETRLKLRFALLIRLLLRQSRQFFKLLALVLRERRN